MRPEEKAAESEFEAILRVGGLSKENVDRVRLEQEIPDIDLNQYAAIIAGGSPFDLSTPQHQKSDTQKAIESFYKDLFDRIVPLDFPFLGACSGNGLLGRYCGATISGKYSETIGCIEVSVTEAGMHDPLLKGLPSPFKAMAGHKEACDNLPPGAILLASSDDCPVQMFRMRNNLYATQFHPEADANEFILRIKTYKDYGYFAPEEAEGLIEAIRHVDTPYPKKILKRFVNIYS